MDRQSGSRANSSSQTAGCANRSHGDLLRLFQQEAGHAASGKGCACCQKPEKHSQGASRPRPARRRLSLVAACKIVLLLAGLLLGLHALSCGLLFCIRLPWTLDLPHDVFKEVHGLYGLSGGPKRIDRGVIGVDDAPKLIPRVIHQTYKSGSIPPGVQPLMQSWRTLNPDWDIRFYDDKACLDFVSQEFPEYYAAYKALPKNVERSDFFRYMVVLRLGGVYADVDTECKKPLNDLILPRDTMLVGWENEFPNMEHARFRSYARERQLLQWVFAAAPGHPALRGICDYIAKHATSKFLVEGNLDTLERTGPGIWTDVVLKHALRNPPSKEASPFTVRILPRVAFGAHPLGLDNVDPADPAVLVLHHYKGTWKLKGWQVLTPGTVVSLATRLYHFVMLKLGLVATVSPERLTPQLYPVSVSAQPPFTMLVNLVDHGDLQAGDDVSSVLTNFGTWQPSLAPHRGPSVLDVLMGGLGSQPSDRIFVDVGAGQGLFSLAAASRGHRVLAAEMSAKSVDSMNASIHFNGFQDLVALRQLALGAHQETICVELDSEGPQPDYMAQGYAHPRDHSGHGHACRTHASRMLGSAMLPAGVNVGSLRVSAPGWEGWIIDGFRETLQNTTLRPHVIMLELHPARMEKLGYAGGALGLVEQLYSMGYTDGYHAGHACDARWEQLSRKLPKALQPHRRGLAGAPVELSQSTWCTMPKQSFHQILRLVDPKHPENLLFTYQGPKAKPAPAAVANATSWEDSELQGEEDQEGLQAAGSLQQELKAQADPSPNIDADSEGSPQPDIGLQAQQADWTHGMHGAGRKLGHAGRRRGQH